MNHVLRNYSSRLRLAKYESDVDLDVLKTAAFLHDVALFSSGGPGRI